MAEQQQTPEPLQLMPQDEDEALAILQGELQNQSNQFTADALQRAPVAIAASNTLNNQSELDNILLAQADTNRAPTSASRVITNETLRQKNNVIANYPAGTRMSASGNVEPAINPDGSITVVNIRRDRIKQNDEKIAAAVVTTPSVERQAQRFDVNIALEKAKTLSGDSLLDFTSKSLADIDVAVGGALQRIRGIAAMESGYTSAKAAYDRELLLDQTSGFAQRYGQASGQTVMAQQNMARTLQVAQALERSLSAADSEIRALSGAKTQFEKLEVRRANRELAQENKNDNREQRQQDKREAIADLYTPNQLANFRFLRGTSGDEISDYQKLHQQLKQDKGLQKLVQADTSNIHQLLVDPDPAVQTGARKLFIQYDKAANPRIDRDAETTDTMRIIDKALKNPNALIETIKDPERKALIKRAILTPKSGKERAAAMQEYFPELLAAHVEEVTQGRFLSDVRTWTGTGMQDSAHPFSQIIKKISATAPDGKVPNRTFIEQFVSTQVQDATGKKLDIRDKIGMLTEAVNSSVKNIPQNMLINADAIEAMRMRLLSQMKVDAATAFIRTQNLMSDERMAGQAYLYSKDFKAPPK